MMRRRELIWLFMCWPAFAVRADNPPSAEWHESRVGAWVERYCYECHQGPESEGKLDLAQQTPLSQLAEQPQAWRRVLQRMSVREMPPHQAEQPADEEREAVVIWLRQRLHDIECGQGPMPGAAPMRRLNRSEYAATLRDLLGIQVDVAQHLPADGAGGEGFDNAAETLFISPLHAEKYLEAAQLALEHACKDERTRERLIVERPDDEHDATTAAREVLKHFLPRAFRHQVTDDELSSYVALFGQAYAPHHDYDDAIRLVMEAALVSPKFIFLTETPNTSAETRLLDDYDLANRLSYFLWGSMPDEALLQLAAEGRLNDPEVLQTQVRRMLGSDSRGDERLASQKLRGLTQSFIEQWLGTRALGREFKPDPAVVRRYDSELEGGLKYEPVLVFEEILIENRSLLDLIATDFTYANRRLAQHYGIKGEFREQPRRVALPPDSHRGGVLTMGAVLAVSSYPHRTSPVLRGKWILDVILGTPPPPPPPNVPALAETAQASSGRSLTLRERLEQHRQDAACATCHDRMDPLGFGLENFDVLGAWRTEVDQQSIDVRGQLPDGTVFQGPEELKQVLLVRKDQFVRNLTRRMLGYALARQLTPPDECVIDDIVAQVTAADFRAQTLVNAVVTSVPFRYQRGAANGFETMEAKP